MDTITKIECRRDTPSVGSWVVAAENERGDFGFIVRVCGFERYERASDGCPMNRLLTFEACPEAEKLAELIAAQIQIMMTPANAIQLTHNSEPIVKIA